MNILQLRVRSKCVRYQQEDKYCDLGILNLGQDGTGSYPHNLSGDIDDLAIWNRALTIRDVQTIYSAGQGVTARDFLNNE